VGEVPAGSAVDGGCVTTGAGGVVAGTVVRGGLVVVGFGFTDVDVDVDVDVEVDVEDDVVDVEVDGAGGSTATSGAFASATPMREASVTPTSATTARTAAPLASMWRACPAKCIRTCRRDRAEP
jgi:hypothetical protein